MRDDDQADALFHARKLCEALLPHAEMMSQSSGRKLHSCLATLIRPLVVQCVTPQTEAQKEAEEDKRSRPWNVEIVFWEFSSGTGQLFAEGEPEVVTGLNNLPTVIREYFDAVHEDDHGVVWTDMVEMNDTNMTKRTAGVRPAISRGGGAATMRINYQVNAIAYRCEVRIERAK